MYSSSDDDNDSIDIEERSLDSLDCDGKSESFLVPLLSDEDNTSHSRLNKNNNNNPPDYKKAARRYAKRVSSLTSELRNRIVNHSDDFRDNEEIRGLTLNKLQTESVALVGRKEEMKVLKTCMTRMTQSGGDDDGANLGDEEPSSRKKELIFIQGYSGVGKSTLAYTLEKTVTDMPDGIFLRGKFDFSSDEPYGGIAKVFGELFLTVQMLQQEDKGKNLISTIGETIVSQLGSEVKLLSELVPEFDGIIPPAERAKEEVNNFDWDAEHERWKYVFRVLTRVMNAFFSTMVVVFDDIQWIDAGSLEVLRYLISDVGNTNGLMIIGCYRSNEVDENHMLSRAMSDLSTKEQRYGFNMTNIKLHSFKLDEVKEIVSNILNIDNERRAQKLSEICFKRTNGNPYFLIEFVTMLEEEGLITFSIGLMMWTWDSEKVESETMSTSNVVHLLQARMQKLSQSYQLLLQYIACLGSTFPTNTVDIIWNQHARKNSGSRVPQDVPAMLAVLAEKDFIEPAGLKAYRWVHDRVQEAALLLGDARGSAFQFEVGLVLYESLDGDELDENVFAVANLINKGGVRKPEFAALNLHAAEKAQSIAAFHSASKFTAAGIATLPYDKWESQRVLTLRLYTIGTETELALGRVDAMREYSKEVLSQKSCSTLDKVPVYTASFHKLSNIDLKYKDTINFCLTVLSELGVDLTIKGPLHAIKAVTIFRRVVRSAKIRPISVYKEPVMMEDPKQKARLQFLFRLLYASYLSKNNLLLIRSTTVMVQLTMEHGVSMLAGPAYANLGLVTVALLHDYETASYFAETALAIQETVQAKHSEANTLFSCYNYVFAWTKPLQSCFTPFAIAYTSGMRTGNSEYAMWASVMRRILLSFHLGKPLGRILAKCETCATQTEELKQHDQDTFLRMFWQVILNLTGNSSTRKSLHGEAYNSVKFVRKTPLHDALYNLARLELFLFFGDYEGAAALSIECDESFSKAFPGFFMCMLETFHRGVAFYAMARKTKQGKYKRRARQVQKTIGMWRDKGNPNVGHYYIFLKAEDEVLKRNFENAKKCYVESIRLAARHGHLHHAALFNERYGDFVKEELKDDEEYSFRIQEAIRFYREWGATAKVNLLLKTQGRLLLDSL